MKRERKFSIQLFLCGIFQHGKLRAVSGREIIHAYTLEEAHRRGIATLKPKAGRFVGTQSVK